MLAGTPAHAEKPLTFSYMGAQLSAGSFAVLKSAYEKLGIDIREVKLPAARALIESNSGNLDGEVHRIKFPQGDYPNLIRVDQPVNRLEGVALACQDYPIQTVEDLKPYHIGVKVGNLYAEKLVKGFPRVTRGPYIDSLLESLTSGRIQIIIVDRLWAEEKIRTSLNCNLRIVGPTLVSIDLYHYLNRKHEKLVPAIQGKLKAMEESGKSETIRQNAYREYKATGKI